MPFYIRRLPVQHKHAILDPKTAPQNPPTCFFNPSRADDVICIRVTEFGDGGRTQKNKALLYHTKTKVSTVVEPPWAKLAPTLNLYQGIEDVRLCWFRETLWFTATTTHASSAMTNEIVAGYFSKDLKTVAECALVDIGSRPVKNLCPFVYEGALCLWDSYKLKIYRLEADATESPFQLKTMVLRSLAMGSGLPTTPLRGSSSPVLLHGSLYGCVVHDIIFCDLPTIPNGLSYIHYWMEFDIERGYVTFLSQPFIIAHWGIEFVSGIHKEGDAVYLYFGVDDKLPMECKTTLHDLRIGKGMN
jgi:hypothetical protein